MGQEKFLTLEMGLCVAAESGDSKSGKATISKMASEVLFSESKQEQCSSRTPQESMYGLDNASWAKRGICV